MHPVNFLFFFVCYTRLLIAQKLKCLAIGTDNCVPCSELYDILQSKKEYMWFTNDQGVWKYKRREFKTHTTADGLSDSRVFRMCKKVPTWYRSQNNKLCYIQNDTIHGATAMSEMK